MGMVIVVVVVLVLVVLVLVVLVLEVLLLEVLLVELVDVEPPQPPPTVWLLTRKSPLQLPLAELTAWAAASENEDPARRRP